MNKLKLNVDELSVESFEAAAAEAAERGTVRGQDADTSTQNTTRVGQCFCTDCVSCRCV